MDKWASVSIMSNRSDTNRKYYYKYVNLESFNTGKLF
jgi:hypothetical protein